MRSILSYLAPFSAVLLIVLSFLTTSFVATAFSPSSISHSHNPLPSTTWHRPIDIVSTTRYGRNNALLETATARTTARSQRLHGLQANSGDDNNDDEMIEATKMTTKESDQLVLGVVGTVASCIMLYSEFVLSQTGCGLPAGPLGLVGAVEGISYLSVVGLGGYSLFQKVTTVRIFYTVVCFYCLHGTYLSYCSVFLLFV